jgi:hypothetical protein
MLQQRQTLTYLRRSVDGGVVQEEAKDSTHCEGGEADEVEMEARKEKQRASLVLFTLSSEVETWRIVCKCDLSTHISVNKFLLRAAIHRMHARVEKAGSHDTIASRRSPQIIMMQYVHIPSISIHIALTFAPLARHIEAHDDAPPPSLPNYLCTRPNPALSQMPLQ